MNLQNARALITGGSEGIGLGIAKALKAKGAQVAIMGRNEEKLNLVALRNGHQIATAFLPTGRISDVIVNVEAPYGNTGVAEMLLDAAREWMRWQADPNPL